MLIQALIGVLSLGGLGLFGWLMTVPTIVVPHIRVPRTIRESITLDSDWKGLVL